MEVKSTSIEKLQELSFFDLGYLRELSGGFDESIFHLKDINSVSKETFESLFKAFQSQAVVTERPIKEVIQK